MPVFLSLILIFKNFKLICKLTTQHPGEIERTSLQKSVQMVELTEPALFLSAGGHEGRVQCFTQT